MISLQPREHFAIVRVLGDHTDATNYYVRATVRDSITGLTLDILALEDLSNRRFVYQYQVPPDVSGLGRYIDVTTEVFTDSGYTAKASTYSDENESYLVWDRIAGLKRVGSGADVDYKKIAKIMKDACSVIEIPESDLAPLQEDLKAIQGAISSIKMPESEKTDFSPVIARIALVQDQVKRSEVAIIDEIEAKEIPEPEKVDFAPVIEAFKNSYSVKVVESATALVEKLGEALSSDSLEKVKENLKTINDFMKLFLANNAELRSIQEPPKPTRNSRLRQ